jgi:hypothetical protein
MPLLLLVLTLLAPAVTASPADLSRFQRTAQVLQAAEPALRGKFATVALGELLEIYLAESDLARREARAEQGERKLYTWSLAVDRYARQLQLVMEDIEQGFPVEIGLRRESSVALRVNGSQIMLTHPRHTQQFAFEQRVLLEFCNASNCDVLTESSQVPLRLPLYAESSAPQPSWIFTENNTVCAFDGVQVFFTVEDNVAQLRRACQQFFQEVNDLLTEMAWQQLQGATIEWDDLEIRPTPGQTEHFVRLNTPGDSVLAILPLIYAHPDLLQQLGPWLRDRSAGNEASLLLDGSQWLVTMEAMTE